MKKISLYTIGLLLGASLVACDDYKEPNPPAQSNKAPEVLKLDDVVVTEVASSSVYDLNTFEDGENLLLASISCDNLQEGYKIGANAFISVNDFEDSYEVTTIVTKDEETNVWEVAVSPQELSTVYQEDIEWSNDQVTLDLRYQVTTTYENESGNQVAIVGGTDYFYGPYSITIIPVEVDLHFEYLYTPGNSNGWSHSASQLLQTDNYTTYYGYAYLDGGFKFTSADNWDGFNFGAGDEEGTLSVDPGAKDLEAEAGLYWCDVNVDNLTYSLTEVTTYGLIGDATAGGWDASTAMEPSEDMLTWTVTTTLTEGTFKFRANDAWDLNLGGAGDDDPSENYGDLVQNGKNLASPGAGTYTITLDLSKLPYSCTVVAQ